MQENTWINNQKDLPYQQQQQTECIRLFVTIRRDSETKTEYQKMTIMAPLNQKVSMLKRLIEREFSDLFPHEPTFICAKLEDEYGYSLSNASQIQELLKTSDRLFAIPETFSKDFIGKMHVTHDLNELTFMMKSITQTIIAKLAEADLGSPQTQLEILQLTVPIGFTLQQKAINHNTALTLKKIFEAERLQFMEDPSFALITQLLVKLLQFWTNDLIFQDQFLLNITVDVLESLLKSATFANSFKTPQIINSLMSVSKVDFVSAQTRSRIIKLISYLSRPTFQNYYQPKPYDAPLEMPQTRMRRPPRTNELEERKEYVPSMIDQRRPLSNRRLDSQQSRTQQLPQSNAQYTGDFQQQQYSQQQQLQLQQRNTLQQQQQQQQQQQYSNQGFNYNDQPQQQQYPNQAISFNQYDQNRQQAALRKSTPIQQQPSYQQQQFQQSRIQTPKQQFPNDPQQQVFDGLVQDYLNLISTESNEEMLQFAVQNLADGIETTINSIMDSPDAFRRVVNLLEIAMNPNFLGMQQRILEQIALNMNEARAKEGIKLKLVQRIMKAFTYQPKEFHNVLYDLLSATLKQSEFQADVLTVISMIESPYERISILGLKILALMSDPQRLNTTNLAMQFENYIKSLMEWTLDGQKGEEFQYNALMTLANLAINDYIRPQILHLKGIEFFLRVLRQSYRVDAQRLAAKALLNLSIKSRETKLSIVSELEDEIKRIQRGDIDTVVAGYLQTLMASRDRGQLL